MADDEGQRKLAAILSADVAGYSRLMADDERATVRTLTDYRAVFAEHVAAHGRIVDTAGDSVLAIFDSVVEAVDCAIAVQRALATRNAALAEHRRMLFRIGVNLGDIIIRDDGTIYGDGVNVAARLETLAAPGGVTISRSAHEQVEGKLAVPLADAGSHAVKNIPRPVHAYHVVLDGTAPRSRSRPALVAGLAAALVIAIGLGTWQLTRPSGEGPAPDPILAMPTGPSIAVLPFTNMTDDPEQDYFADGMTADIITDLSHLRGLFVIAQNSTFQFKGKAVDVREVGRELGVSHVLEGGIRRAGEQVRINVRLIDARSGAEVWAQRYDRPLNDIFAVQDEIGRKIVTELDVQLAEGEAARTWRRTTTSPEAYDYFLRAREARLRFTKEDVALAKQLSERALELDPEFAMAMVVLGRAHRTDAYSGWTSSVAESYEISLHWINRAIEIDPALGEAYNTLGEIYFEYNVDSDRAIGYLRKAVELDPNSARNNIILAASLAQYAPEQAIEYAMKAMRLNPNPPGFYFHNLGVAYLMAGRTEQAIDAFKKSIDRVPDFIWAHQYLTIAYAKTDRLDEARQQAKEVLRINPNFVAAESAVVKGYNEPAIGREYLALLQQAGLK